MELQKYIREELLGIKTDFMFLVSKNKKVKHKVMSRAEAFGCIDLNGMTNFTIEMAKNIGNGK